MKVRVFTAFSGYDSQCLALERLKQNYPCFDYELVGWSEIDKPAIASHNALFPEYADRNYGDISKINWELVPDFDLFTYSFPCTDYSICGNMRGGEEGSGTKSALLWECVKAIKIKRPKFCLMENVKNMVSKTFTLQFIRWVRVLEELGYTNTWQVLNAANYGSCQARERVFLISIMKDSDEHSICHFPKRFDSNKNVKEFLDTDVEDRYYYTVNETKLFLDKASDHLSQLKVANILDRPIGKIATPLTTNGLVPTIMASGYEGASYKNMIAVSFFPKLGVLEIFK